MDREGRGSVFLGSRFLVEKVYWMQCGDRGDRVNLNGGK
jgi:hypothetical protein